MSLPYIPAEVGTRSDVQGVSDTRLHGYRLVLARLAWCVLVAPALLLFVVAIPALYTDHRAPPEAVRAGLAQLGHSASFYAAYYSAIFVTFAAVCFAIAAMIASRKSDDGMALFISLFLVLLGAVNGPITESVAELYPALLLPARLSLFLLCASLILFFFLFPNGQFVPRWMRGPVLVWAAGLLSMFFDPAMYPATDSPSDRIGLMLTGGLAAGAVAQIYRYVRVSDQLQRQQTKWVVFGAATATAAQIAGIWISSGFFQPGIPALLFEVANVTGVTFAFLLIPLSIGVAILRYRLWEIDIIINRTLVFGVLTASVAGIYVLVVGGLGALLQARGSLAISLLATGLVAVLFAPLRDRLQRGVNRLMYGERDDPYAVLSRLGKRLEATLAPDAVLSAIVETVKEALKLPYAAITLMQAGEFVTAAEHGHPIGKPAILPLVYQNETIGQLLLAQRSPGETFSPSERRLLEDITRHAGVAAHGVRLTAALQRSREQLVTAREEERRRLRRDLHDGLGPQLAALTLKLETARNRLAHDPVADTLLTDLATRTQGAVADIRRLVYDLRPPALDELGLISALREGAAQYGGQRGRGHGGTEAARSGYSPKFAPGGLEIVVEAPEHVPPLPAAVEVAAYRIAQEALTNVVRHAHARTCTIRVILDDGSLCLEVSDDGRGLPERPGAGLGLQSMRERAEELGGTCLVEPVPGGGTSVRVRLPM